MQMKLEEKFGLKKCKSFDMFSQNGMKTVPNFKDIFGEINPSSAVEVGVKKHCSCKSISQQISKCNYKR